MRESVLERINSKGRLTDTQHMTVVQYLRTWVFYFLSAGQCVRQFHMAANASCVFLSWNLVCEQPLLLSFVLEWQALSGESSQGWTSSERVEWLRVASSARDLQLCRKFVTFMFGLKF